MPARQSVPPTASVTARSSTILAGSCTAVGRRHRSNAVEEYREVAKPGTMRP